MSLQFRWASEQDLDRVALCRVRCFGHSPELLERLKVRIRADDRAVPQDMLLAEMDGEPVGTTTGLSMTMRVRGAAFPVQGVAWVGTVKTLRRAAGHGTGQGVASQLMRLTLDRARERGQVLSALMPWRASYYEHFGYGLVERRCEWTIPLALLPSGATEGWAFVAPADPSLRGPRQKMVEAGQCDIERPAHAWGRCTDERDKGFTVAQSGPGGAVRNWMYFVHEPHEEKDFIRIMDFARPGPEDLLQQLHFLASLRDQYHSAILHVPVDVPLNLLLKEHQLPHRLVNHETAEARATTRMQVRVLDHVRLIEGMKTLPANVRGAATVAIRESEGTVSRFRIELDSGRASVKPASGEADVECTDYAWAPIILGDLPATRAAQLGLITVKNSDALMVLDAFSAGAVPFCNEYF